MILDVFKSREPEPHLAFPRCQHRSPAGRQCSQPICSSSPHFCLVHKPKPEELTIAELTAAAGSLSTPEEIHRFLTTVTLLRIQDRLTPKEACAYAYLCQILQRGQREIAFHQKLADDRAEHAASEAKRNALASWSIPRPDRSEPSDNPPPKPANSREEWNPEGSDPSDNPSPASLGTDTTVELSPPASPTSASSLALSASEGSGRTSTSPTKPSTVEVSPPASPVSAKSSQTPSNENSKRAKPHKSSESSTSSTSLPMPPDFYNHLYPFDPTLPPGLQDPRKNIPPPDAAECARLNARRGFRPPRLYRKAAARFFNLWR